MAVLLFILSVVHPESRKNFFMLNAIMLSVVAPILGDFHWIDPLLANCHSAKCHLDHCHNTIFLHPFFCRVSSGGFEAGNLQSIALSTSPLPLSSYFADFNDVLPIR
jgi:hypothetical protein